MDHGRLIFVLRAFALENISCLPDGSNCSPSCVNVICTAVWATENSKTIYRALNKLTEGVRF